MIYVLMLQTDSDDRILTESVLAELKLRIPVRFLDNANGLDAFIPAHGRPSLILLSENGRKATDLVRWFKTSPAYHHIPLIVLMEDLPATYTEEYYRAGANSIVKKPSTVQEAKNKVGTFFKYWLEVAEVIS